MNVINRNLDYVSHDVQIPKYNISTIAILLNGRRKLLLFPDRSGASGKLKISIPNKRVAIFPKPQLTIGTRNRRKKLTAICPKISIFA